MDRRYVDVDWLIESLKVKDHVPLEDEDAWAVIDWLNKFPVVDIVRCKDCKHSYDAIGGTFCSYGTCVDCIVDVDFFCKNGER